MNNEAQIRCDRCGRTETSNANNNEYCNTLEPDGYRCPGIFRWIVRWNAQWQPAGRKGAK